MKTKVRFKAISNHGKLIHFTHEFEHPKFEVKPPRVLSGVQLPKRTVESQVISWLDDQDKSDLMCDKDLSCILDYWIPIKVEKITLVDFIKQLNLSEQVCIDLLAVYTKIKPSLKGMSVEKQVSILFSHLDIGYESAKNAYKSISKLFTEKDKKLLNEYKNRKKNEIQSNTITD